MRMNQHCMKRRSIRCATAAYGSQMQGMLLLFVLVLVLCLPMGAVAVGHTPDVDAMRRLYEEQAQQEDYEEYQQAVQETLEAVRELRQALQEGIGALKESLREAINEIILNDNGENGKHDNEVADFDSGDSGEPTIMSSQESHGDSLGEDNGGDYGEDDANDDYEYYLQAMLVSL